MWSPISGKNAVFSPGGWSGRGENRTFFFFENRRQQDQERRSLTEKLVKIGGTPIWGTFWRFWGFPVKTVCQTGLPEDASQQRKRYTTLRGSSQRPSRGCIWALEMTPLWAPKGHPKGHPEAPKGHPRGSKGSPKAPQWPYIASKWDQIASI